MATAELDTSITVAADGAVSALLRSTSRQWAQAVDHRFVRELFAGTIDDAVMRDYLVQDYQFFESFLSMLGACVAHADALDARLRFAKQLGMLVADEDTYFVDSFAEFGVSPADYRDPELTAPTTGFRDLMDDAVASAEYPQLLIVLVVAEWLYLDWAESRDATPPRQVHRGWIDLHRGDAFRAWVQFLVDELERVFPAEAAGAAEATHLARAWQRAVDLECAFFDDVYRTDSH
ncbi:MULTISPECIES: TenA family protein [unclassified Brevibacterium]|uniref:TenA family protein n=1 Tax=unclassified Brevibacterium TaxID=2614124 RepID=UPI001092FF3A|nr:TenA family protein [Brevibacterium sp. S22]TGD28673.1 transcriptional regulator, TENA/THI-4 family protein [Brevibacterium sp. S22]